MMDLLKTILSSEGYIPHGHCYLWKPELVWLHVVSNGAIALAYFSIPVLLIYFVSQRKDVPFNWVLLLFGAFIIACGSGHLIDIWTIWHPNYWISGILKAITAAISVYTALELIPLIPKLLALPSPAQLEAANQELERALYQLQQTQTHLIHTEKMSSLGQLVAGVAHEINNPINFIVGNLAHAKQYVYDIMHLLQIYQQTYPEPISTIATELDTVELEFIEQDLPKVLESMQLGANRIRQIVLSLRNFSRLDESEMKRVNLHDGIDSTLLILQNRLKEQWGNFAIRVERQYGELPLVECYAGQLNQVFMHILNNAIDALKEAFYAETNCLENRSVVTASCLLLAHSPTITIQTQCLESDRIFIQISDNGAGISPETQQTIFNPFFTTKKQGKASGLGLSICYQIVVEQHGGALHCTSEPGRTVFSITIPLRQTDRVAMHQRAGLGDGKVQKLPEPASDAG
jgi:two-component system, NtrC family, sensor kinase